MNTKIILLFLLGLLIIFGAIYWFSRSFFSPVQEELKKSVEQLEAKKPTDVLSATYNDLVNKTKEKIEDIKKDLYQNSQNTLDKAFSENSNENANSVEVTIVSDKTTTGEEVVFDLSSDQPLNLKLQKNKEYLIKFKNIEGDKCLFINSNRYELKPDLILKLSFSNSGTYKIKTGPCLTQEKDLGELVVD